MVVTDYELVVIGSGPAGQKGAIAAAKAGKRVALVAGRALLWRIGRILPRYGL